MSSSENSYARAFCYFFKIHDIVKNSVVCVLMLRLEFYQIKVFLMYAYDILNGVIWPAMQL